MTVLFFYLYYLYCLSIFQRTCCFRFKSGCKGKGFIFNYQTFSEVFFSFSFYAGFSGSLCERERRYERITLANFLCESDCKDKNFIYYNPNFFGSFLFFSLSGIPLFHEVNFSRLSSLGKRVQKYALFKYTPNLNHSFFELFLRIEAKVLNHKDVVEHKILGYRRNRGKACTLLYSHAR